VLSSGRGPLEGAEGAVGVPRMFSSTHLLRIRAGARAYEVTVRTLPWAGAVPPRAPAWPSSSPAGGSGSVDVRDASSAFAEPLVSGNVLPRLAGRARSGPRERTFSKTAPSSTAQG